MVLLLIIFIIALVTFVVLYGILLKATIRQPDEKSMEFATVYAGTADKEHQGADPVNIDITANTFLDEQGNPIKVDEYEGYVVSGNSMELANIRDGNLLLVRRNEVFTDNTPLPGVFVLKREHVSEGQGKYKMRRIWAVAYLGETDIEKLASGIMNHPEFMLLKRNKNLCLDEAQMLSEFTGKDGRMDIYKKEHPRWNESGSDENRVVISTTLRTESDRDAFITNGRHISFSVHPANLVVGKVAFAYSKKV